MSGAAVVWFLVTTLVPPMLAAWWGRELLRHRHAPLFAEQFWAFRQRFTWFAIAGGLLCGLTANLVNTRVAAAAGASAVLLVLAVVYNVRRRALDETWTFGSYLVFRIRVVLAFGGLWLALLSAPDLAHAAAEFRVIAGLVIAGGLLAWVLWSPLVSSVLIGAVPLRDPRILEAAQPIIDRAHVAPPLILRAGPPGGISYNAFALPSLSGNRVLFFATLLERLTPAEVAAILAHEIAHLEEFSGRLWRQTAGLWVLALCGATIVPWLFDVWPAAAVRVVWLGAVLGTMALLGHGSRTRESQSDARALELTGDPDLLVSALRSVHDAGLIPRRLDADFEARSTHPTLARRIQAVYALAGRTTEPAAAATLVIACMQRDAYVIADETRIRYLRKVRTGASDALDDLIDRAGHIDVFHFDRVSSVHLEPGGDAVVIVIRATSGERTGIAVARAHAAALQVLLDSADARFAPQSPLPSRQRLLRLAASIAFLTSLLALQFAVVIAQALVALLLPSRAAAAAVAAAGFSGALLLFAAGQSSRMIAAALFMIAASVAARAAATWPVDAARPRGHWVGAAALTGWTALAIGFLFLTGTDVVQLARAAAATPTAVAAPVSLAAWFLATARRTLPQLGALGLLLTAIVVALVGTTSFIDRIGNDSMLTTTGSSLGREPLDAVHGTAERIGQPVAFDATGDVRVSPGGTAVAVLEWCEDVYGCDARRVTINAAAQTRTLQAKDLRFVDDERASVLESAAVGAVLRVQQVRDGTELWAIPLPGITPHHLAVDANGRWTVLGTQDSGRVRLSGLLGDARTHAREWGAGDESEHEWYTADGDVALRLFTTYSDYYGDGWFALRSWLRLRYDSYNARTSFYRSGSGREDLIATTTLRTHCADAAPGRDTILCSAYDGFRSHLWTFDGSGALTPLGWVPGEYGVGLGPIGTVSLLQQYCNWQLIDAAARRRVLFDDLGVGCPVAMDLNGAALAALDANGVAHVFSTSLQR
jgi:Zn-dependent protease with chaperone function